MTNSQHASHDRAAFATALLVLAGAAFVCVQFAWQSDVRHLLVRIADDASYFLTTARNIAAGRGMTFDGIHPTNGFHPLWLLLYPLNGSWHAAVYNAAVWAREHTAEGDVFAMTDSGDFALLSCRRVINLDGLANNMEYQRAIADRRVNQYLRSNHVRYLVQHAVHGHDAVVQGNYDSLVLNFESQKFGVFSDGVLVRKQDEAYRSAPYFDGADRVVLLIWSL